MFLNDSLYIGGKKVIKNKAVYIHVTDNLIQEVGQQFRRL
jgi:hypothetical protein